MIKKLFSTLEFYSTVFTAFFTKGFTDKPKDALREDEFYYSTNRIYTKNKVKKMYFLYDFPKYVDRGFLHDMKRIVDAKMKQLNKTYGTEKTCELVDIVTASPYEMNFSTFKNRSRMMMWKSRYERALREYGSQSEFDEMISGSEVSTKKNRNQWMIESWLFVKRFKESEKGEFCRTNIIFELIADSDDILNECEAELKDYVFQNDIKLKEVFLQSNEYNKLYTPASSFDSKALLSKMNPPSILTDTLINSFDYPTHGHVGDETGTLFGTDIYSGFPLTYDLSTGSDAINILLSAKTGEGKSNYMKGIFSSFDILDYHSIILDYEGDEYSHLAKIYDSVVVKVSGEDSRYFNTIAIGDLTGIEKIDKDLKTEAIKITERVFSLLLDEHTGMTPHELALYSDAINRVYEKFGVTDDRNTWYKSKDCTYYHIYGELVAMSKEDRFIQGYGHHISDMLIKLKTYFENDGINHTMFTNPINLDELLGSKHIVFSFGMKGIDESLINTKELSLKQLFIGYITTLVSNYNKSRNKLTVVVIEELQRYLGHASSGSVVANMVSGGRKRGMIMFLITNAPLQLMTHLNTKNSDARETKYLDAILSNINCHILGRMEDQVTDALVNYYGLHDVENHLYKINKGKDMKYSFMVHYKGEYTIVKYILSPLLLKTPLYKTRDNQNKKESQERKIKRENLDIKEQIKSFK